MSTPESDDEKRRTVQVTATVELPEGVDAAPTAYERERDEKSHRLAAIGVIVDGLLALLTFVAVAVAVYVARLNQTAIDAATEANVLTKQQITLGERPWVSNEPAVKGTFSQAPSGQWVFSVIHNLKNHGKSPAVAVQVRSRLLPLRGGVPEDPHAIQREICAALHSAGADAFGETVFPGQTIYLPEVVGVSRHLLAEVRATYRGDNPFKPVPMMLIVCVSYQGSFDANPTQTGLILTVGTFDEATGEARSVAPDRPPANLQLMFNPSKVGATN